MFWVLIVLYFVSKARQYTYHSGLLYTALVWLLLTSTKYIPDLLINGLEKQYATLILDENLKGSETYIQVLGSGSTFDLDLAPQERLSQNSLARMSEGIRIYKEMECAKLVFSGYSATNNVTQAAITRDAAIALGIPEEDILILETPSTTEEEALAYKTTFGTSNAKLILVTSDYHMPRAMMLFSKYGLDPIAAPSDHVLKRQYRKMKASLLNEDTSASLMGNNFWWKSSRSNFDKFYSAMHEYIGLLWAKM